MKLSELPDTMIAQGRHAASTEELLALTGLDRRALHAGLRKIHSDDQD